MNKLKRILAGLSVGIMCLTITPVSASAATYAQGDINGDGTISTADTMALSKFLNGQYGSGNNYTTERLDVDSNGVIDDNDLDLAKKILVGNVSGHNVTYTNSISVPAQSSRKYYTFSVSGTQKGSYTLSPVSAVPSSSPRTVFGTDTRKLESGFYGVIKIRRRNESYGFTGFVVDDHTILTCAHGLYSGGTKGLDLSYYDFSFYNEEDHIDEYMKLTPIEYHVPAGYVDNLTNTNNYEEEKYDYALITVQDNLSQFVNFYLGVPTSSILSKNYNAYITGIPNGSGKEVLGRKATSFDKLLLMDNYNLQYNIDTSGGQSGSPIYIKNSNNTNTVVGIHTYGNDCDANHTAHNHGTRITTDILHFVYNNPNLKY